MLDVADTLYRCRPGAPNAKRPRNLLWWMTPAIDGRYGNQGSVGPSSPQKASAAKTISRGRSNLPHTLHNAGVIRPDGRHYSGVSGFDQQENASQAERNPLILHGKQNFEKAAPAKILVVQRYLLLARSAERPERQFSLFCAEFLDSVILRIMCS